MTRDSTARAHPRPRHDPADDQRRGQTAGGDRTSTGRRSRIHDDLLRQRLLDAIRVGAVLEDALAYAGLPRSTYYAWLNRGRTARDHLDAGLHLLDTERPYLDFLDLIEHEIAAVEVRALGVIRTSALNGSWRAAAWWLERRYPARYGRASRGEPEQGWHPDGGVSISALDEAFRAVVEQRDRWAAGWRPPADAGRDPLAGRPIECGACGRRP